MVVRLIKPVIAPVLIAQAKRLRRIALELPEPIGARHGIAPFLNQASPPREAQTTKVASNDNRPLTLLVAGDSSAAGVGAHSQAEALAVQLASNLATRIGRDVQWQLIAQTGLTSLGLQQLLSTQISAQAAATTTASTATPLKFDVAVIIVGVNDITNNIKLSRALLARSRIVRMLRARCDVQHFLFPGLPAVERFPLLPQPLAWYGGAEARRNNALQTRWAAKPSRAGFVSHLPMDGFTHPKLMASDGFHPSPVLYAMVAAHFAAHLAMRLTAKVEPGEANI